MQPAPTLAVTPELPPAPAPEPAAPPPPADYERIPALDLIRGVAILGILVANIPWFSGTGSGGFGGPSPDTTVTDRVVKGLTLAFVDAKFISQLAVLFGAGLALQADRAWAAGRRFTWRYLWRTFLLFCLGLAHAILLWFGDILMTYACVSVAAVLLVRLRRVGLLVVAGAGLTWMAACLTALLLLALLSDRGSEKDKPPPGAVATPESVTEVVSDAFRAAPEERGESWRRVRRELVVFMGRENQTRIYREGSYREQLFDRAVKVLFMPKTLLVVGGDLLACFLLGAFLVRAGFFSDPEVHRRWRGWLLAGGLLLGVPLHAAALILTFAGGKYAFLSIAPHLGGALGIAAVYLTLLTGWAQTRRAAWLQDRLKAVGRLALTNYLLQTVICTTIFYSFGFALYAKLGRPTTLLVVLGVCLLQLLLSPLYLKLFPVGPVEWVWRFLSGGRRSRLQPLTTTTPG